MTILVGFSYTIEQRCTIVLGSDSRITGEFSSSSAEFDAHKITPIQFPDHPMLIAKAGTRITFDRFEEMLADAASKTPVSSQRDMADCAERVMRDLKRQLVESFHGEDVNRQIDAHDCEILMAYFFGGRPYFYSITLSSALAVRRNTSTVAIGSAAELAHFLLTSIDLENPNEVDLSNAVVAVLELCKLHDAYCGGESRIGVLDCYHGKNVSTRPLMPNVFFGDCPSETRADNKKYHRFLVAKLGLIPIAAARAMSRHEKGT